MSRHSFSFLISLLIHISILLLVFWLISTVKPQVKKAKDHNEGMVSLNLGKMIAGKQIINKTETREQAPPKVTNKSKEVAKSQKIAEPKAEPKKIVEPQKFVEPKPQKVIEPKKVIETKPQKVVEPKKVVKPKEVIKPQKVVKPKEVVKPKKVDNSQAEANARAKAQAEADARAKAQAEADARAKAQAEADARAKAQAEADARAKAQAEADARAKAQAEADARAKAQAEADARAKAQAEAKKKSQANKQNLGAYKAGLQSAIDRSARRNYPKSAKNQRKQGTVKVRFTLTSSGQITNISVVGSSGNDALDKGAVKALKRLGRYKPPPPEGFPKTQEVPVRFSLSQ